MRCYLYDMSFPEGKLFTNEDEAAQAIHDGAVDHPSKVGSAPEPKPAKPAAAPAPAPKLEAAAAPFDILQLTIADAEDKLQEVDDPAVLKVILKREKDRFNGPRKGILALLEERARGAGERSGVDGRWQ